MEFDNQSFDALKREFLEFLELEVRICQLPFLSTKFEIPFFVPYYLYAYIGAQW